MAPRLRCHDRLKHPVLGFIFLPLLLLLTAEAFLPVLPRSPAPAKVAMKASGLDSPAAVRVDRRQAASAAAVAAAVLLSSSALSLPGKPVLAAEPSSPVVSAEDGVAMYTSPTSGFSFAYPATMKLAPKLVKTHLEEVTLKSEVRKGFSVGVAVDPVKIQRIQDIGSPADVGKRIVGLEQRKEGVTLVELLESRQANGPPNDTIYYCFDYVVESTRGEKRYLAKAGVKDQRLYVLTVEVKRPEYDQAKPQIDGILESFMIAA